MGMAQNKHNTSYLMRL